MIRQQLACRYGIDAADDDAGIVVEAYPAATDLAVIKSGHPDCIVIPYDSDEESAAKALDALGRTGPEPQLLGDPPTKIAPTKDELRAAGVPETISDEMTGEERPHPMWAMAGKVYPDNRVLDFDTRPYTAPRVWTKEMLLAYAAQERWTKETGGTTFKGQTVSTSRDFQTAIERLASRASRDSKFSATVKGFDKPIAAADLVALADAVSDHVQVCFAAENTLKDDVASGKAKTRHDVDQAFSSL